MRALKKAVAAVLIFSMFAVCLGFMPVRTQAAGFTESGCSGVGKLSVSELVDLYYSIPSVDGLYKTAPVVSGTGYRPAVLSDQAYGNAIGWLNYYRRAAGLPAASLNDALNLSASYGALCLAMNNTGLSHTPSQPADMSSADYNTAYAATSSSNLSYSMGYGINSVMHVAISGQIDDEDYYNRQMLGHRRWLLNPETLTFGVGTANNGRDYYTDIRVFGTGVSTQSRSDWSFISWPASGYNLSETFYYSTPSSGTLNPSLYQSPGISVVNVELKRESDGKVWSFGKSASDGFFNINNGGYGIPNCIIFVPEGDLNYEYSGSYQVHITGLKNKNGSAAELNYKVNFVSAYEEMQKSYTGFKYTETGRWRFENGSINYNYNDIVFDEDEWRYYYKGMFQDTYTGVTDCSNEYGWWYVKNGVVDFGANTVASNSNGWWKVTGGKVDFNFTGLASNTNGWWYLEKGKVNFSANTVAANDFGWWKVTNGAVDFNFTGLASNANGWWYLEKGKVNFGYTGFADNSYGRWRIEKGTVNFNYRDIVYESSQWRYYYNGLFQSSYTGVTNCGNASGWWYVKNGVVDFSFNGVAANSNGSWYVTNGKVDFSINGTRVINNTTYRFVNGKVS